MLLCNCFSCSCFCCGLCCRSVFCYLDPERYFLFVVVVDVVVFVIVLFILAFVLIVHVPCVLSFMFLFRHCCFVHVPCSLSSLLLLLFSLLFSPAVVKHERFLLHASAVLISLQSGPTAAATPTIRLWHAIVCLLFHSQQLLVKTSTSQTCRYYYYSQLLARRSERRTIMSHFLIAHLRFMINPGGWLEHVRLTQSRCWCVFT